MAGWLRGAQWRGLRGSLACAAGGAQRRNCAGLTGRVQGLVRAGFVDAGQLALVRGIHLTRQLWQLAAPYLCLQAAVKGT